MNHPTPSFISLILPSSPDTLPAAKGNSSVKEAELILALLLTQGIGRVAVNTLLHITKYLNTPLQVLNSSPETILHGPLGEAMPGPISLFLHQRKESIPRAVQLCAHAVQQGITIITIGTSDYPTSLQETLGDYAPPILFIKGNPALLHHPALAIVGTREPTKVGKRIASACATLIGLNETFIADNPLMVSGGARGVDTIAHHATLAAGAKTLVIVPQGIFTFHIDPVLFKGLHTGNVTIVSEFSPDASWETHAAVTRNATISAFARVVCVVEPWKLGGSIRTARIALKQGKPVLVRYQKKGDVPSQILQKAGALSLTDAEGVLSTNTIVECWKSAVSKRQSQPELF